MTWQQRSGDGVVKYVFLHGTPSDGSVWSEVMARRPAEAGCALLDLPDHGRARDEAQGSTAALEARVAAHVAELGDELVLVGHSYGAYLCGRLAARLPGRIARMVLISGFAGLPAERALGFAQMARQLESGELGDAELASDVARTWYGPGVTPDEQRQVALLLEQTGPERRGRLLARLAQLAQPELRVAPYPTPCVVLHAERDAAVAFDLGRELCALGSNARLEAWDSASHMLPLSHGARVASAIFSD